MLVFHFFLYKTQRDSYILQHVVQDQTMVTEITLLIDSTCNTIPIKFYLVYEAV